MGYPGGVLRRLVEQLKKQLASAKKPPAKKSKKKEGRMGRSVWNADQPKSQ